MEPLIECFIERYGYGHSLSTDLSDINKLNKVLLTIGGTKHIPEHELQKKERSQGQFITFVLQKNMTLVVARHPETLRIIGMASVYINILTTGTIAHIQNFAVLPEYWGCGISDCIDEELRTIARETGVEEIELTSNLLRTRANNFYIRRGYKLYETNKYKLEL